MDKGEGTSDEAQRKAFFDKHKSFYTSEHSDEFARFCRIPSRLNAHWPDEAKRKEFLAKLNKYFEPWHGDALYRHVPELRKQAVLAAK